jgi:hypothetical protein
MEEKPWCPWDVPLCQAPEAGAAPASLTDGPRRVPDGRVIPNFPPSGCKAAYYPLYKLFPKNFVVILARLDLTIPTIP